jgi:prepilin peptidase CpaA
MSHLMLPRLLPLLVLLLWAAVEDLRRRRIPNWLNYSLVLGGIAQSFTVAHTVAPAQSLLGLLTGFGLTFFLFAIEAVGAGDVKLMAGVGAWLGPVPTLGVFCVEKVLGLAIVLTQAARQGKIRVLFRNSAIVAAALAQSGETGIENVIETGRCCRSIEKPLPYAVPVLVAVVMVAAWVWR